MSDANMFAGRVEMALDGGRVVALECQFDRGNQRKHFTKRPEQEGEEDAVDHDADTARVMHTFRACQQELDGRYDKHERLVKRSRDVTIESKRIIFLLHRISGDEKRQEILDEAKDRLDNLRATVLCSIAEELVAEDPYLFLRSYTAGIQEYIEALSYYHYLQFRRLISYRAVRAYLTIPKRKENSVDHVAAEDEGAKEPTEVMIKFPLPPSEYILGVADLTGELMRRCISSVGTGDISTPFQMRPFMREILEGFSHVGNSGPREVTSKLNVLRQNVNKVENACYAIQVRRKEFPDCAPPNMLFLNQKATKTEYSDDDEDRAMADF